MFESLALYPVIGFAAAYLALEIAWHFTACKIKDKTIKPCMFKQVVLLKQKYTYSNRK
jgi:hypothetical protein